MKKQNPLVELPFQCPLCGGSVKTVYEIGNAVFVRCYNIGHGDIIIIYK